MGSSLNQRLTSTIFCAGIGLLVASSAVADYAVDWFKVSSGGGSSQGGDYSLSGTVGQTGIGTISASNFAIEGGFWGLAPRSFAPQPPTLFIRISTNQVVISWVASVGQFVLEQSGTVDASEWTPVSAPSTQVGARWLITIPLSPESRFYRLRAQ